MSICRCKYAMPDNRPDCGIVYICRLTGVVTDLFSCRTCVLKED